MFDFASITKARLPLCEVLEPRLLLSTVDIAGTIFDDLDLDGSRDAGEPPVPGVTVFADQDGNGVLNSLTFTQQSTPAGAIPDAATQAFTLAVAASAAPLADLNVHLDITHPSDSDLVVSLISPTGTRVELFANVGGSGAGFTGTVLDDEAAVDITAPAATAPFSGVYRPAGGLADFDGELVGGTWTLEIADEVLGNTGTLDQWSLELTLGDITTVTDANGEYSFEGLPPTPMDIRAAIGAGGRSTGPAITSPVSGSVTGADIGIAADGSVSGVVYVDDNGDGVRNEATGESGRRVYVDADADGLIGIATDNWGDSRNFALADCSFVVADIAIGGVTGLIRRVAVTVDIDHTNVSDLSAWLISPAGTQVELFAAVGGGGDNFQFTVLDDGAAGAIEDGTAPFSGTYRPSGRLADLFAEDPNGLWRLLVADAAPNGIGGILDNWSLSLDTGDLDVVTDVDGAYQIEALPAGEYSIRLERQDGWLLTAPAEGAHEASLASGEDRPDVDFGAAQAGTLTGLLWHDADADTVADPGESPLVGWQVFWDADNDGAVTLQAGQEFSNAVAADVPDQGTMTSALNVAGAVGCILDVNVRVSIDHTYVSDLDVFLISPQGTRVELFTDIGDWGENLTDVWLDDQGGQDIADASSSDAPFTGVWRPEVPLAGFNGELPTGTWLLEVSDDSGYDTGTLLSWSLDLTTGDPTAVTDTEGEYSFTRVLPGEWSVRLVSDAGWAPTVPTTGVHVVSVTSGAAAAGNDFGARVIGDMNGDTLVTADDVEALAAALNAGSADLLYDVNGDGYVTGEDMDELIEGVIGTSYGDSDLDGDVDLDDFVVLKQNFGAAGSWTQGDFDHDGDVDLDDFVILKQNFGAGL